MGASSGGLSPPSMVNCAPDGTLLAAIFLDPEADVVTVVIEPLRHRNRPFAAVLTSANGAWRGQHELIPGQRNTIADRVRRIF